jgi:hypothetical protein
VDNRTRPVIPGAYWNVTRRGLHRVRSFDHHVRSSRKKRISPFLTVRLDLVFLFHPPSSFSPSHRLAVPPPPRHHLATAVPADLAGAVPLLLSPGTEQQHRRSRTRSCAEPPRPRHRCRSSTAPSRRNRARACKSCRSSSTAAALARALSSSSVFLLTLHTHRRDPRLSPPKTLTLGREVFVFEIISVFMIVSVSARVSVAVFG